jgi:hypothetical protein
MSCSLVATGDAEGVDAGDSEAEDVEVPHALRARKTSAAGVKWGIFTLITSW